MRDTFDDDFARFVEEGEPMPALPTLKRNAPIKRRPRKTDYHFYEKMGAVVGAEIAALRARVVALESRQFRFLGVWSEGLEAAPGNACAFDGSTWIATETTSKKPSTPNSGWVLSAKRGRDGRSR